MNSYKHLTKEEKENARTLLEQGFSLIEIAFKLKRYPSKLSCVFRENAYKNCNYIVNHAQELSANRRCSSERTLILKVEQFHRYVHKRHIRGRSAKKVSERVNIEALWVPILTIYSDVKSDEMTKLTKDFIQLKWECKIHKSSEKLGEIKVATSLLDCAASIETRIKVSHLKSVTESEIKS